MKLDLLDASATQTRHGFRNSEVRVLELGFASVDTFQGETTDPITLHKYLYANDNPVQFTDANGHAAGELLGTLLTITAISTIQGGIAGLSGVLIDHKHQSFWDGFVRGFLSTFITDSLSAFTPLPATLTVAAGTIGSDIIVDIAEGHYMGTKREKVDAVLTTMIDGFLALGTGALIDRFLPVHAAADSQQVVAAVKASRGGKKAANAIGEVIRISTGASIADLLSVGANAIYNHVADAFAGVASGLQDAKARQQQLTQ